MVEPEDIVEEPFRQPFAIELRQAAVLSRLEGSERKAIGELHLDRAHRLSAQLRAGIVWVNTWLMRDLRTPFGGVGSSGLGREGGAEAMRFFTEPRNVCLALLP